MFRRKRSLEEKPAVELIEEAFQLLRRAPAGALAGYYVGSLPFVLGLLYFWSDMARSAFAEDRLLTGSLVMTLLFIWMKAWQSLYAHQLLTRLCGEPAPRWSLKRFLRAALYQAIVQPAGLILLPIALPLIVPFGWAYPFFTNATVFAAGDVPDIKTLVRKSWQQACLWPMQSQTVIFSFKFFGFFVALNLFAVVYAVPFLMKSLLGIDSVIMRTPWAAMNTTVLAGVVGVAWLCVDPVIKATFALRCFYGESLRTGQDLRAELKSFSNAARAAVVTLLTLFLGLGSPSPLRAANDTQHATRNTQQAIPPKALDRSIDEVIQKREYSWRLPREAAPKEAPKAKESKEGFIAKTFKSLGAGLKSVFRVISDFFEWLDQQSRRPKTSGLGGFHLGAAIKPLLFVLIVLLVGVLIWLVVRVWKRRGPGEEIIAEAIAPMPNVADENVGAEQLPEEGWVRLARDLLQRGELRLALRAFYLASLAALAGRNLITLAKFKSNRDYERELLRRSHALQEVPRVFSENVSVFERSWYGLHEVTPEMLDHFAVNVERIQTGS
ncbi:MAG TPA: DUF4129 domain-containing protein [Verrucomicrobiae bacterium]|nr:DUF4129 domain-containing protein [Verrucomicrobiae bacterium]